MLNLQYGVTEQDLIRKDNLREITFIPKLNLYMGLIAKNILCSKVGILIKAAVFYLQRLDPTIGASDTTFGEKTWQLKLGCPPVIMILLTRMRFCEFWRILS